MAKYIDTIKEYEYAELFNKNNNVYREDEVVLFAGELKAAYEKGVYTSL